MGACLSINSEFDKYEWINAMERVHAQAEILMTQKEENIEQMTNEIVSSLQQGSQEDHVLHQAKQLIKEEGTQRALQLISVSCDGILLSLDHIANARECPKSCIRYCHSLIFAATRGLDIPELKTLNDIFKKEFGKEFVAQATELRTGNQVDRIVISGLSTENYDLGRTLAILNRTARENNIDWVYAP